jgi:chromosome segregation ATPase
MAKNDLVVRSTDNIRTKLANRKQTLPEEISPELAAQVVKAFILPMFQNDTRNQLAKNRAAAFGLEKVVGVIESESEVRSPGLNPHSASDGTVLSELKLSEQLLGQINELQNELRIARFLMKDATQQRESLELERAAMQNKLIQASSNVEFFKLQYEQLQLQVQKSEFSSSLLNSEVTDLKRLTKDLKTDRTRVVEQLNEEKSLSDKLRNRVVELEHSNHLIKMGSDIMSDHLRGLYEAVEGLTKRRGVEETLMAEVKVLSLSMSEFRGYSGKLDEALQVTLGERDMLLADCNAMSEMRLDLKSQMEKFSYSSKDRILSLQQQNNDLVSEQQRLMTELAKVSKSYKDLATEHDKVRQKVKSLHKQTGKADHVLCRNCHKLYTEDDNFNWSCRVHLSEFNGEMWWCCGKNGNSTPGCKAGKHLPKGDEYEEEEENRPVRTGIRCSVRTR